MARDARAAAVGHAGMAQERPERRLEPPIQAGAESSVRNRLIAAISSSPAQLAQRRRLEALTRCQPASAIQCKVDGKGPEGLEEFVRMRFYGELDESERSLFDAYLRRKEDWKLGIFLDAIGKHVDQPRRRVSNQLDDQQMPPAVTDEGESVSETELLGAVEEDVATGVAPQAEKLLPKGAKKKDKVRPKPPPAPAVPTEEEYRRRVERAAERVERELALKLDGKGDRYGNVDVRDEWRGYERMGKSALDYFDDILGVVAQSYPQSSDDDRPYFNWVYKGGHRSNFTVKSRKRIGLKAEVNVHFNR